MIASLKPTLDKSHFSKTTSVNSAKGNVTSRKVTFLKTTCSMEVLSAEISAISQSSMVPKEMESLSCKCSSTCICSNPPGILGVRSEERRVGREGMGRGRGWDREGGCSRGL